MSQKILYDRGDFYLIKANPKTYEVYRNEGVAARRVASIGVSLPNSFSRACDEVDKRWTAQQQKVQDMRCNQCHRPMAGTTAYDGACECSGLIEVSPK